MWKDSIFYYFSFHWFLLHIHYTLHNVYIIWLILYKIYSTYGIKLIVKLNYEILYICREHGFSIKMCSKLDWISWNQLNGFENLIWKSLRIIKEKYIFYIYGDLLGLYIYNILEYRVGQSTSHKYFKYFDNCQVIW